MTHAGWPLVASRCQELDTYAAYVLLEAGNAERPDDKPDLQRAEAPGRGCVWWVGRVAGVRAIRRARRVSGLSGRLPAWWPPSAHCELTCRAEFASADRDWPLAGAGTTARVVTGRSVGVAAEAARAPGT